MAHRKVAMCVEPARENPQAHTLETRTCARSPENRRQRLQAPAHIYARKQKPSERLTRHSSSWTTCSQAAQARGGKKNRARKKKKESLRGERGSARTAGDAAAALLAPSRTARSAIYDPGKRRWRRLHRRFYFHT